MFTTQLRLGWIVVKSVLTDFYQWFIAEVYSTPQFKSILIILLYVFALSTGMTFQEIVREILINWITNLLKAIADNSFR